MATFKQLQMGKTFSSLITRRIIILIIIVSMSYISIGKQCQINPNCFQGCSDSICVYDPSKNPFYNSSIILANQSTYNGSYCCSGCNLGYFLWDDNITCSSICNVIQGKQQYGNPLTRKCNPQCPLLYYGDPTTTKCVTKCPQNYWISLQLSLCVSKCPSITNYYYLQNLTCLNNCPSGNYTYLNQNNMTICDSQCNTTSFKYDINMTCIKQCPDIYYGDRGINKCVENCPQNSYKQKQTKICTSLCSGVEKYSDDITGYCVQKCSFNQNQNIQFYGDNFTSKCVSQCPYGSYAHKQILICVQQCFQPYPQTNYQYNICQSARIIYSLSSTQIAIISSTVVGGILIVLVLSFLLYKFYIKKRLIRKSWAYGVLDDLHFSL